MIKDANILIVDDLPENLKLLSELLNSEGYHVRPVTNGKLALSVADAMPPDLILLDINMPIMDGFETCQRFKASEKMQHIPIIFLSANIEPSSIIKGFEIGAIDYITKPFNAKEVLIRIKTQLDLKLSQDMIEQKNREQKELLHILCHDLLNSVGAIKSILELKKMDDEFSDYDDLMLSTADNAVEVIDLVRQIKSVEEEKIAIELCAFNVKELIDESMAILKGKIQQKSIEIVVNITEGLTISVERVSFINSVLNNLLTNAIKFSFEGSKIVVSAKLLDNTVCLSIKDFGIGMPNYLRENLFKMEKPTTRQGTNGEQGTGFGMPLVEKFVVAYGGKIAVFSQEKSEDSQEQGTEVKLWLKP